MIKKAISILLLVAVVSMFAGCTGGSRAAFDKTKAIGVVSREDGSGTRGAFIELFGIEARGGEKRHK